MTNATEYLTETLGTRKTPLLTPVNPLNTTVDSVPNEEPVPPLNIVFAVVASKYRAADAVEDLLAALKDKPETKGVLLMSKYTEKDISDKGPIVSIKNGGTPCFNALALESKDISIMELRCKESEITPVARDLVTLHSFRYC